MVSNALTGSDPRRLLIEFEALEVIPLGLDTEGVLATLATLEQMEVEGWRFVPPRDASDSQGPTGGYTARAEEIVHSLGDGPDVHRAAVQISDLIGDVGLDASRRVTVLLYLLVREGLPAARLEEIVDGAQALQGHMYDDPDVAHQLLEWAQGLSDQLDDS